MAASPTPESETTRTGRRTGALIALVIVGAGYPALFHQVANLQSGFYGAVAPVNWSRVGLIWLVGLLITGVIAVVLWRLTGRPLIEMSVAAIPLGWGLAFLGRFHNGLGQMWDVPARWITLIVIAALALVGMVAVRAMRSRGGSDALALAVAVPIVYTAVGAAGLFSLPDIEPATSDIQADVSGRDVWIVVLDAMPSPATLRRLGSSSGELADELAGLGYQVPDDSRSAFTHTYPTLGSAFSLQKQPPADVLGPDQQGAWLAAMEGSHPVAEVLTGAGYDFLVVDNAFSFTRCGPLVTECLSTPLTTEFEFQALINSAAVLRMPDTHPWTRHTLVQLDQLMSLADVDHSSPRLIYAHLLMPHKPFDYDADCRPLTGDLHLERSASVAGFLDTVSCLSDRLGDLARAIPEDDLVLIIGDHGSDLRSGLDTFTGSQLQDRLSAFVAVKGCDLDTDHLSSNVNAYRGFAECLTSGSFPAWMDIARLTCTYTSGNVRFFDARPALATGDGMACESS